MKYKGSKSRLAKEILPIILKDRKDNQYYVEPFCGGCNSIDKVSGNRIANDSNKYLIAMWKALVYDNWKPTMLNKSQYYDIMYHKDNYPLHEVGWAGFNCSYCGDWFKGFAGETKTSIGTIRDYQSEAIRNISKQVPLLKDVLFKNVSFNELEFPVNSIVYCDPPYAGTSAYKDSFDSLNFWDWVRSLDKQGHIVFVSEYNAPDDFECVWQKEVSSSLSIVKEDGKAKKSIEKLFKVRK